MPGDASYATHSCLHACTHTQTHPRTHTLQLKLRYIGITGCHLRPQFTLIWNGLIGHVAVTYVCLLTHIHKHLCRRASQLATHLYFMNEPPVETHKLHRLEECQLIMNKTHEGKYTDVVVYCDTLLLMWTALHDVHQDKMSSAKRL